MEDAIDDGESIDNVDSFYDEALLVDHIHLDAQRVLAYHPSA